MELLLVVLIVGILTAIALPQYNKAKERAIGREAIANLKLITAAEKIYRLEANAYFPVGAGSENDIGQINDYLRLAIPEAGSRNWDYEVSSTDSSATASRTGGAYSGCVYTMVFSGEEPSPNESCP